MPLSKQQYYSKEPSPPLTQLPATSPHCKSPHGQQNQDTPQSSRPQQQVDPVQDDEIQLVKVSAAPTTNRQDYRNDYISRVYQKSPTRIASSPRVFQSATDSWQEDASTEPITLAGQESPFHHTPKRRTVIKTMSPTRGTTANNPIDLLASTPPRLSTRLSLTKSKSKRKADEIDLTTSPVNVKQPRVEEHQQQEKTIPVKRSTRASEQQELVLPTNPALNADHLQKQDIALPAITTVKKKETAIANTTMGPPEPGQSTSIASTSTAPAPATAAATTPTTERNKKLTKEEEATKVHEEIDYLMKTVKCLPNYYKLVDKIGEGTFSTVYKALDIRREFYNNDDWEPHLLNSPTSSNSSSPAQSPTSSPTEPSIPITTKRGKSHNRTSNQYVALKRIYHTSSPRRIATEIGILRKLKGSSCISPLITAFRQQDEIFVVMPYIPHDDFKATFYTFSMTDMKHYLRSLFTALMHLHKHQILHRDVKPNNFLYNVRKRTGYLIDFGLAEHEKDGEALEAYAEKMEAKSQTNIFVKSSKEAALMGGSSVLVAMTDKENSQSSQTEEDEQQKRIAGYVKNDARHQVRANRAGTRGFRAPEILMRVTRQTCAIDIWAAGVIFLCFFSGRYPFFLANDESDSIVELCQIYGYNEMKKCAELYNRNFDTNLFIPTHKAPLSKICEHLNKEKVTTWDKTEYLLGIDLLEKCMDLNNATRMTAAQALEHPFLILQDERSSSK